MTTEIFMDSKFTSAANRIGYTYQLILESLYMCIHICKITGIKCIKQISKIGVEGNLKLISGEADCSQEWAQKGNPSKGHEELLIQS